MLLIILFANSFTLSFSQNREFKVIDSLVIKISDIYRNGFKIRDTGNLNNQISNNINGKFRKDYFIDKNSKQLMLV
ncbi:MAG TPA: hypothetical protein VGC75_05735, partial [Candidatus Nitrosocosmicus sp.]